MAIPQLSPEERQAALEKGEGRPHQARRGSRRSEVGQAEPREGARDEKRSGRRSYEGVHPHRDASRLRQGEGREDHEGVCRSPRAVVCAVWASASKPPCWSAWAKRACAAAICSSSLGHRVPAKARWWPDLCARFPTPGCPSR